MYKQVIVVRGDLKLSKGKLATHVAHASYSSAKNVNKKNLRLWEREGQKKITLRAKNLSELLKLKEKCDEMKLPNALISDAGLTELRSGTMTALGIGPDREEKINKITGSLPLLK